MKRKLPNGLRAWKPYVCLSGFFFSFENVIYKTGAWYNSSSQVIKIIGENYDIAACMC